MEENLTQIIKGDYKRVAGLRALADGKNSFETFNRAFQAIKIRYE